jgi:hypothetical protein
MKDPSRWLELSSDEFERDLLRSSRDDVGSERAYRRTLTSLGVGVLLPMTGAQAAEAATDVVVLTAVPSKSLGAAVLLKWLGGGMLLGVVTASGIALSSRITQPELPTTAAFSAAPAPREPAPNAAVADTPAPVMEPEASPAAPPAASAVARRFVPARESSLASPEPAAPALPAPHIVPSEPELVDTSSLEREVRLLDTARRALSRRAPAEALTTLRAYAKEFEHGSLAPEARVLEVRALLAAGEAERAHALGRRIIAADPQGRHAETVRALLARASNP